jgi:hypothetical protein
MDISDTDNEILSNIQNLQTMEKELFATLEKNINNNQLSDTQKNDIINKINQLAQNRIDLYYTLGTVNNFYQKNLSDTNTVLTNQTNSINIVEEELNTAKRRLSKIKEETMNNLRLVEINNYYTEQYKEHAKLMKIVIFTFIPILLFTMLWKNGLLDDLWYMILCGFVSIVGIIWFLWIVIRIWNRDNMNYQEFDWFFLPSMGPMPTGAGFGIDPWAANLICIGQQCCYPGSTWDPSLNQCSPDTTCATSSSTTSSPSSTSSTSTTSSPSTTSNLVSNVASSRQNKFVSNATASNVTQEPFDTLLEHSFIKHSQVYKKPDYTLNNHYKPLGY